MFHDLIGHISFGISAASFMMRKILFLRILAIISLSMSLYYNYFLPTGPLWVVLFWLCIFLIINLYQSGRLVFDNLEYTLSEEEKDLLSRAFPSMRTRDFKRLISSAIIRHVKNNETIISKGGFMNETILVGSGELVEKENEYKSSFIRKGQMLGESTFVLQDNYGGSPSDIFSNGDTKLYCWDHKKLRIILDNNSEISRAFLDGTVRGLIKKKGLLLPTSGGGVGNSEFVLSERERLIHALGFPRMTTKDVNSILTSGEIVSFGAADIVDRLNSVGMVIKGGIYIDRDDGQHIKLGVGNFIGEIGWASGGREIKVKSVAHSEGKSEVVYWSYDKIRMLQNTNPGLFSEFVYHIARDMGLKLTYPLTEGNVYEFSKIHGVLHSTDS